MKPDFLKHPNIGQIYDYAMSITTQQDADSFFKELVMYMMDFHHIDSLTAETAAKSNIGYWSGYYDHDTAIRMNKLFGASHPFLGSAPFMQTNQEIFDIGFEAGRNAIPHAASNGVSDVDGAGL